MHPPQVQCDMYNCNRNDSYLTMQLGISVCDLDGNNKIFSLDCLAKPTVKRIFGWESSFAIVDIFHQRRRPKNEICYARGLANKQKMKFEGGTISPQKEGFLSAILLFTVTFSLRFLFRAQTKLARWCVIC